MLCARCLGCGGEFAEEAAVEGEDLRGCGLGCHCWLYVGRFRLEGFRVISVFGELGRGGREIGCLEVLSISS